MTTQDEELTFSYDDYEVLTGSIKTWIGGKVYFLPKNEKLVKFDHSERTVRVAEWLAVKLGLV